MLEQPFEDVFQETGKKIEERVRNQKWTTAEGKEIKLKDMDKEHINNCIEMMKDRIEHNKVMIEMFEYELDCRGITDSEPLQTQDDLPW